MARRRLKGRSGAVPPSSLRATVEKYTPESVAAITSVPAEDLHKAAEILARNKPMAVIWSMGITQYTSGVLNVLCLANLQMVLGNLGVRGGGVNPLRGQDNVQGAGDMGALPNVFPGYQTMTDPTAAAKFDTAWALAPGAYRQDDSIGSSMALILRWPLFRWLMQA
jgi:predicted molibdopterin-dependent oxidoreductase YjgC